MLIQDDHRVGTVLLVMAKHGMMEWVPAKQNLRPLMLTAGEVLVYNPAVISSFVVAVSLPCLLQNCCFRSCHNHIAPTVSLLNTKCLVQIQKRPPPVQLLQ